MANGKFSNGKRTNLKPVALLLAIALMVGTAVGGTLAWLTDKTDSVKNTFTVGNVDISLEETTTDYKMIPGHNIAKDPTVTVEPGSEDCWLFVEITESADFDDYIDYGVITGADSDNLIEGKYWNKLGDSYPGVYYCCVKDVPKTEADGYAFPVIGYDADKNGKIEGNEINTVHVKDTVTKEMMDALTEDTYPTLTFTAYAVQYYKTNGVEFGAEAAWAEAK